MHSARGSADALVILGDLIDFVDYHDYAGGIMGTVFGPDAMSTFARLRRERAHTEVAAYARSLWTSLDDAAAVVEEAVREQYARLFAAMPAPTYATPGNVDVPHVTQDGDSLNCTMGNWTNEPTAYSYNWQLDGSAAGSDSPDLTVTVDDVGKTATCTVTATNGAGSTTAPPSVGLDVAAFT